MGRFYSEKGKWGNSEMQNAIKENIFVFFYIIFSVKNFSTEFNAHHLRNQKGIIIIQNVSSLFTL